MPVSPLTMPSKKNGKQPDNESPLYFPWLVMCNSCTNPSAKDYSSLGGKGITVCDEWKDFRQFESWSRSHGWEDGLKINRIDLNGQFSPNNCVWGEIRQMDESDFQEDTSDNRKPVKPSSRKKKPKLAKGQTTLF